MRKNVALAMLAVLLLTGCASLNPALPDVATKDQAKAAASFCNVAEYMPIHPGDGIDTQAEKASNNAKGAYLKCEWAS